jgi:hypothetical protein
MFQFECKNLEFKIMLASCIAFEQMYTQEIFGVKFTKILRVIV